MKNSGEIIFPIISSLGIDSMGDDFFAFATLVLMFALGMGGWIWRRMGMTMGLGALLLVTVGVLGCGWKMAADAGAAEQKRMVHMLSGLAATYVSEVQHLGHNSITLETAPDDPVYLSVVEAEIRWLKANPQVSDIYTYCYGKDGRPALLVDCETDYNHDGRIEGETEARSEIGEPLPEAGEEMFSALKGTAAFAKQVTEDRWGSWFTYCMPLRLPDGTVHAALGIDLDSKAVIAAIAQARSAALQRLGILFLALVILLGGIATAALDRRSKRERILAAEKEQQRGQMENLVLAMEGIVWEGSADCTTLAYVSPQVRDVLGWEAWEFMEDPSIWLRRMHPEDKEWSLRQRCQAAGAAPGKIYQVEYRMMHKDGSTVWVRERGSVHAGESGKVLRGIITDITSSKEHARELDKTQRSLVEASRQAGMAEVATGVLHNVGNVLNSVNISSSLITDAVRATSLPTLKSVATLLLDQTDLPSFMAGPRGSAIPGFLRDLHARMEQEQASLNGELHTLTASVEHIKEIVMMQQSYARMGGRSEPLDVESLVEDALHINSAAIHRHRIEVIKDFEPVPRVLVERNKVLQILVNLLRNSKHAIDDFNPPERLLRLGIKPGHDGLVDVVISDNGAGISGENLKRLFSYGFTTRKTGHGFGLHSSVNTAREMGGGLTAASAGEGLGASFCLSLPIARSAPGLTDSTGNPHAPAFESV